MKKSLSLISLCLFVFTIFIGMHQVSASVEYGAIDCQQQIVKEDGTISQVCNVGFKVINKVIDFNKFTVKFTLTNTAIDSFVPSSDFKLESQSDNSYVLTSDKSSFEVGTYILGTLTYHTVDPKKDDCIVRVTLGFDKINRSCSIHNNNYYDKNGNKVDELTYKKECEPHSCEILSDGTMYGKNGNVVDQETYDAECGEKPEKYICTILPDGTIYGKNGNVVDQETYDAECGEKPEKYSCTILPDGTIYGKNGNVVDQETYDRECTISKNCTISGGKYYGPNGEELDEMEYRKQCEKPICKQIGGVYYDQHGNVTTEENYLAVCKNEVNSPQTGNILSTISVIFVGVLGFGIIRFAKKHDRFI